MSKLRGTKKVERVPVCWDYYIHGVTQSLIFTWLSCRHHAYLNYVCGWKPREYSKPLEFGSAFHYIAEKVSAKGYTLHKATTAYTKRRMSENPTDPNMISKVIAEASVTYPLYERFWESHNKKYTFVEREDVFRAPLTQHDTVLTGRRDGLVKKGKTHLLFETKTKGKIDEEGIEETLQFDIQTNMYLLALSITHPQLKTQAVLYDVVRQSQLRQGVNEDLKAYCKRLSEDIQSRPQFYFHRWEETLTTEHTSTWYTQQLSPILTAIREWYDSVTEVIDGVRYPIENPNTSPLHYKTPATLLGLFGGKKSEYFDAITRNDFTRLYRSSVCFPELLD